MKLNKPLNTAIALLLTVSAFSTAHAASDNTEITLSHTYAPYVNFTGTAPGASRFYDNGDVLNFIFPVQVNLGTMGLASNVSGDCDLDFSTQNNFKLRHTVNNDDLANYRIIYRTVTFEETSNPQLSIPCNTNPTDLDFILVGWSLAGFDAFIPAGIYRDVVTVTVTTQ
ncbi:hypothetical protein GCM10009133_01460 [Cocleimonas flava]|uniref:Spore coat protein U-like protein n=2 Tax=Cocleimonas flava TaxID=634765 RepID=A0A4R1EWG0_9GAMM|nr:hypothetical protein EV695_3086 [Cocleimonas flava]